VIYVPQYNPTTVVTYGVAPIYGYYPTPYPSYYYPYPPGAALATGMIWGRDRGTRATATAAAGTRTSTSTATPASTAAVAPGKTGGSGTA
jgi:hypothetical protein